MSGVKGLICMESGWSGIRGERDIPEKVSEG